MENAKIIWFSSVNPDNSPHLVPLWHVVVKNKIWICTSSTSIKIRNIKQNPFTAISLEDGTKPIIANGTSIIHIKFQKDVVSAFIEKYDWNIESSREYDRLIEVEIHKWVMN